MDTFIKCFVRDGNGAWRCIQPAELALHSGRVQVAPGTTFTLGTMFMGVDLAAMLEEHHRSIAARS